MCATVLLLVMIAKVRVYNFLPFHLILRVLAVESDLRPLGVQLLLHNFKEVFGSIRVPGTQINT